MQSQSQKALRVIYTAPCTKPSWTVNSQGLNRITSPRKVSGEAMCRLAIACHWPVLPISVAASTTGVSAPYTRLFMSRHHYPLPPPTAFFAQLVLSGVRGEGGGNNRGKLQCTSICNTLYVSCPWGKPNCVKPGERGCSALPLSGNKVSCG
jgi:hypothetical protein